ncbi:MAG: adenylate/guanylate cyclase domain-containing protein [Leptospiraceae bacterium]|nr:adenylate/guanylate cyclase domain-containing protein [Leptospiraceae bacterium]
MDNSVFNNILKERESKNEKSVALIRLLFVAITIVSDLTAYFGIISLNAVQPDNTTILLDFFFLIFSVSVCLFVFTKGYSSYLKYFTITCDYLIISMMLAFDPTVSKEGEFFIMAQVFASVYIFFINLLRYSKAGTIYSAALALIMFAVMNYWFNVNHKYMILPMSIALLMMLYLGYSLTMSSVKMMIEANTKKMMERYLPPELVGELYKTNVSLEPGGNNQVVTILFSDIRSFTTISESMSPQAVVQLLNDYLSTMTDIIFANRGTIDKFIGDAIMTIFGAPVKKDDDAFRAVNTALEMMKAMKAFNEKYAHLGRKLEIGIGIHTGEVIVGNIGSDKRLDYTVIGDNVNLSSRIEGLTKQYKCPILISEATFKELSKSGLDNSFCIREVDDVIVKGKTISIKIYEVFNFETDSEKEEKKQIKEIFELGLRNYQNKNYLEAEELFKKLPNDEVSKIYLNRIQNRIPV